MRIRLICLPYAGGGTASYRRWSELLPDDIDLCLVQLPGREMRMQEKPYDDLDTLVDELVPALEPLLDKPVALFGHSMGALIALVLARRLRRDGYPGPEHLLVSGRRAPQIPDPDPPLHQLPDGAFVTALVRRYNGIPQILLQNVELLRLFLPTLRADLTMIETYRLTDEPPLDVPIAAFGGREDTRAPEPDLALWQDVTTSEFTLRMFPGGHFFIQTACENLVASITELLTPGSGPLATVGYRHSQLAGRRMQISPTSNE